jgi:gamma-butyrobetaine dioxygenase
MNTTEKWINDWRPFHSDQKIQSLNTLADALGITWSDGRVSPFHFEWLRDNCPCHACVYELTREQVFEIVDVEIQGVPNHASVDEHGRLHVAWQDGHVSRYEPGWLRAHAYDAESRAERADEMHVAQAWGAGYQDTLKTFDCASLQQDDTALLAWLKALRIHGVTLVTGVPVERGTVRTLAERISFVRESNFGTIFNVESKPDANSNAYTSFNLPPHTDLPTRELQPGLQFLHCLVNDAQGGDSIFVDGYAIAEKMRSDWSDDFHLLTTIPLEFRNKDTVTDYRWKAPLIQLGTTGEVIEVRVANFLRGPFDAPPDQMPALYRAYRRFLTLARDPSLRIVKRLRAGDMWVFDNRRILHARTAFDPSTGKRHLQGCYVDRDELVSRIRVLERSVGADD